MMFDSTNVGNILMSNCKSFGPVRKCTYAMFDVTCFPASVIASDVNSNFLLIHPLKLEVPYKWVPYKQTFLMFNAEFVT